VSLVGVRRVLIGAGYVKDVTVARLKTFISVDAAVNQKAATASTWLRG